MNYKDRMLEVLDTDNNVIGVAVYRLMFDGWRCVIRDGALFFLPISTANPERDKQLLQEREYQWRWIEVDKTRWPR